MTVQINGTTGIDQVQNGSVQQSDLGSNVAGNGPCFSVVQLPAQTIVGWIKLNLQVKHFDVTNAFDSTTNYRFQPTVAGYYQVNGTIQSLSGSAVASIGVYKNGVSAISGIYVAVASANPAAVCTGILYMNGTTDYLELFGYSSISSSLANASFSGFLARAA